MGGRILVSASVEEDDEPKKDLAAIEAQDGNGEVAFRVSADIYEGSECPQLGHFGSKGKKLKVEIGCGKNYTSSDLKAVKEGRIKWYQVIEPMTIIFPEDQSVELDFKDDDDDELIEEAYQKRFG